VIIPDMSLVIVINSLRKDPEDYRSMTDMFLSLVPASITISLKSYDKYIYLFSNIHRVWKKLIEKHPGNFRGELKLNKTFRYVLDAALHVSFILCYIHMDI
jgi:hypothetical protein